MESETSSLFGKVSLPPLNPLPQQLYIRQHWDNWVHAYRQDFDRRGITREALLGDWDYGGVGGHLPALTQERLLGRPESAPIIGAKFAGESDVRPDIVV